MIIRMEKIGIDVGGVILEYDLNFSKDEKNEGKFVENSIETIELLSNKYELFIVSFCNEKTESKVRSILEQSSLRIPKNKWIFTRTRAEKADVCIKYNIDRLIDDTYQIHQYLLSKCPSVKRIWFNPDLQHNPKHKHITARNWSDIRQMLLPLQ